MTVKETAGAPEPKAAYGHSLADFRTADSTTPHGLLPAEEKLVAAAARGEWCEVSDLNWTKDDDLKRLKEDEQCRVRPEVLRCLTLGADAAAPLHEKGIQVIGAFIPGNLDLEDAELARPLWLVSSYFEGSVILRNACTRTVSLGGCRIAGLEGDRAVFLADGFTAEGEVRFLGTEIGGNLSCKSGTFQNRGGDALSCDRAKVRGTVFLSDGFISEGEVRLLSAEIGGDLACGKAATFQSPNGNALICDGATVAGALFFRGDFTAEGKISMAAAQAQSLIDNSVANNKDGASALTLDGFTYKHLSGGTPTDAKARAAWLQRQPKEHLGADFKPQPFEQLAKVLRAMGHEKDAREIGFLKETLFRPQRVARAGPLARPFVWLQWWLYGLAAGFGYKPHRLLWILVGLWLGSAAIYWQASRHGFFAPADPQVWTQQELASCRPPVGNWTHCPGAKELPPFRPLLYSADVLLPIVDMGQRKHWEPMKRKFLVHLPYGYHVRVPGWPLQWLVAVENVFGTLLVLLFGAIASGFVSRD